MMVRLILACMLLGVASCVSGGSAYTTTSAICENPNLDSQVSYLHDKSRSLRKGILEWDRTNFEREITSLDRRLKDYDATVAVQYQTVTSSCKAYAVCMDRNHQNERRCGMTFTRWQTSEANFNQLTAQLAQIEADTERLKAVMRRPVVIKPPRGPRPPEVNHCDCNNSVGGVFANCCYPGR